VVGSLKDPSSNFATQRVVLVAEDNDLNFELISAVLDRGGLSVRWARDGQAAVTAAAADDLDLLILDLHLPELSGLDVLKRLRADPLTSDLPVLVLTADAMAGTREEAMAAGASEMLTKPFELGLLRATVERLLK
jgi:CheY-like chemotaxis protein